MNMHAADIMTRNVATLGPEATVQEIAELLMARHISAVPIVDGSGSVVGMVSEGDLIRRQEMGTDRHPSWWLELLGSGQERASDYVKSHGRVAKEIMSTDVISVAPDASLSEIAELLESERIKRVPVVENGSLVGLVSRADLVRGLATYKSSPQKTTMGDRELREAVTQAISKEAGDARTFVNVIVSEGVVHLWGGVGSKDEKTAARIAAESVAGAGTVVDHLGVFGNMVRSMMWAE